MIENITPTERSKKTKLKMEDIKCKFYDENVCVEHCDMTEEQLWEYANDPDPDHTDCEQWHCNKDDDMFYYNDDTGQREYHKSDCIKCNKQFIEAEMEFFGKNDEAIDGFGKYLYICKKCQTQNIKGDKINMKIYFAHPKATRNTEYELNCLDKIKELHPGNEIINSRNILIAEEDNDPKGYVAFMKYMNKYYFPVIDKCDIVMVAKTKNGKISPGVQKEIKFAIEKGVKVEYLDVPFPEDNRPTVICHFCGTQVIKKDDTCIKDDDIGLVDACYHCNGIDPCFGCKYTKTCINMGGTEKIEKEKCQWPNIPDIHDTHDNSIPF